MWQGLWTRQLRITPSASIRRHPITNLSSRAHRDGPSNSELDWSRIITQMWRMTADREIEDVSEVTKELVENARLSHNRTRMVGEANYLVTSLHLRSSKGRAAQVSVNAGRRLTDREHLNRGPRSSKLEARFEYSVPVEFVEYRIVNFSRLLPSLWSLGFSSIRRDYTKMSTDLKLNSIIDLFRRLPVSNLSSNLTAVLNLIQASDGDGELTELVLNSIDQPLTLMHDAAAGLDYLVRSLPPWDRDLCTDAGSKQTCDYNRDGDSYR